MFTSIRPRSGHSTRQIASRRLTCRRRSGISPVWTTIHPASYVSQNLTPQPNLSGSGPGGDFLGSDLRKAYYGTTGTLNGAGQVIGLLEFVGYNPADYQRYFSTYGPPLTTTVTPISTDGTQAICTTCEDAEQSLDIEYAISMAPGLSQCIVYVGSTDASMLNRMATDNTAKVISCSWSWRPADPQVDDPFFQQMAAQGQTFASASGDSASWGSGEFNYPQEDGNVLCVGGTSLVTNGPGGPWQSETGWADSGGGISPDTASAFLVGSMTGTRLPAKTMLLRHCAMGRMWRRRRLPELDLRRWHL